MFGKCQVCDEKDKRIEDLKLQVDSLNRLVFPPIKRGTLPLIQLEQDAILSGADYAIQIDAEEAVAREADNILTGNY